MAGLAGTHVNTWVILILDLLQSSFPHGNVDRIHLALLKDVMSVGPFIIKAGLNLVDSLADISKLFLNTSNIFLGFFNSIVELVNFILEVCLLTLQLLHLLDLLVNLVHNTALRLPAGLQLILGILNHSLELPHVLLQLLLPLLLVLQLGGDSVDLVLKLELFLRLLLLTFQLSFFILANIFHPDLFTEIRKDSILHSVHFLFRILNNFVPLLHRSLNFLDSRSKLSEFNSHSVQFLAQIADFLGSCIAVSQRILEPGLEATDLTLDSLNLGLFPAVLHGQPQLFTELLLPRLESADLLVVPPLGFPRKIHGAAGDNARLLVECSVQRYSVVPLSVLHFVGNLHGVLGSLAHQGVVGHEEHGSLDVRGLVLEHVVQQLHPLRVADVAQPLLQRLGLDVVQGQEGLRLQHLILQVLNTLPGRLLCVHHDGLHVATQLLGDGHVVLLVDGIGHVDQSVVHTGEQSLEVLHDLLLLLPPVVLMFIHPGVPELAGDLLKRGCELVNPALAGADITVQIRQQLLLLIQLSLACSDVII